MPCRSLPKLWLLLVALSACQTASASAADLFVNNLTGDDRANGAAAEFVSQHIGPFRSIGRALRTAQPGDRIHLAANDEPYRESISLNGRRHSGSPGNPFVIVGNGAILDGRRPVPEEAWEHVGNNVFRFRPERMHHQILYLDGIPAERVTITAGHPADRDALPPLAWTLFERAIYFRVETDRLPMSYDLTHTFEPVGVTLYEVRNAHIENLTVQGFQRDGVNCHDDAWGVVLRGVTARGNARSGFSIGGSSRVELIDCLGASNGTVQLRTEGWCELLIRNSQFLDASAPALSLGGGTVVIDDRVQRMKGDASAVGN